MANMNKVFLMGNLTRGPDLKYTASGMAVCKLGLAVNRRYRDKNTDEMKDETCFVDITVWGKTGENCGQYLSKGKSVLIEGRLKFNTWESEGKRCSKLEVVAENVQFLSSRNTEDTQGTQPTQPTNQPTGSNIPGEDADTIPF